MPVVEAEESEYQSLEDPFDSLVALVLFCKEQELNPWDIDLSRFWAFTKRVRNESDKLSHRLWSFIRMAWEVLNHNCII